MKRKYICLILVLAMMLNIMPIANAGEIELTKEETNLDKIVGEFKEYYSKDVVEYNYLESMILRSLNVDEKTIQDKLKMEELSFEKGDSYKDSSSKEYAKAIMGILGAGFDPMKYKDKNYIDFLLNAQTKDGYFETSKNSGNKAEDIAYSILALDMAGADYDLYKAVKLLESKFTVEENKAFVKEWEFSSNGDLSLTALSLIALSNHREIVKDDLITKAINYIESEGFDSGMYGGTDWSGKEVISGKLTSIVVQALVAAGGQLDIKTIDGLLELQENNSFKENEDSGDATAYVLAALVDASIGRSIFQDISRDIGDPTSVKIFLTEDSNEVKVGKEMQLLAKAYDANNKYNPSQKYIWSSDDLDKVTVDENTGIIKGINIGKANITVKVKGFEEVDKSIEINVVGVGVNSINIKIDEDLSEIEVGKKTEINAIVLDSEGETVENADVRWEINPKELGELNDTGIFTALKPGNVKITASIEKASGEILSTNVDLIIVDRKTKVDETLEEVKNAIMASDDKYDHTTAMALSLMGVEQGDIVDKVNKYSKYVSNTNTRALDIMMATVIGKNPKDYDARNYVQELLDNNFYDEEKPGWLANAIIALDMVEEKYDESKAIKSLTNKLTKSSGKYYIKLANGNPDNENTALILIALSKHKDVDGVKDVIAGIKNHLKSVQNQDGLIDNCKNHSLVIQAIISCEEDIYSDEWSKTDKYGNKITMLDALLSLKTEDGFKATPAMGWAKPGEEVFAFAALSDLSRNKSMYSEFNKNKPKKFTIKIQGDSKELTINQGETIELKVQVFQDGNPVNNEVIWESMGDNIVSVKDGKVKGLREGQARVRVKVSSFEDVYDEVNIKVNKVVGQASRIVINELGNSPILKNDKFKLSANVFDDKKNKLENMEIEWESSKPEIIFIDESGNAVANGFGTVDIIAKVKSTEIEDKVTIVVFKEEEESNNTINSFVDRIQDYYETIHYRESQSTLEAWETATFMKAGFSLDKWSVKKDYQPSYDMNLKYLGNKSNQALVMLDIGENPTNYKGRNLIEEIIEEINKADDVSANQRYLMAVIAVDKFNEKYKDQKISYNEKVIIDNILSAQTEEGGFKERGDSPVAINTGLAIKALSKHKDFEGVEDSINKAIEYLHSVQKDDGAFYTGTYVTGNNVEIISGLLSIGEDLTSDKWTKNGMNPIESMFILWNDKGSFDNQLGESINNRGWVTATQKSLYTLIDLKEAGYSNYIVRSKMISDIPEEAEETLNVYTAIAVQSGKDYELKSDPGQVTINNKSHSGGFTALGSLQATTSLYDMTGFTVTSIYGIENKGLGGWIYAVNDKMPDIGANEVELKEGDKVVWFYSPKGMEAKIPTWKELTGEEPEEPEEPEEDNKDYEIKTVGSETLINGRQANLKYEVINLTSESKKARFKIGLYDSENDKLMNYSLIEKQLNPNEEIEIKTIFLIPIKGKYYIKKDILNI